MNIIRLFTTFLILLAARPVFNHSIWTNEREEFVADAGTMTVTTTLIFISRSEVIVRSQSVMPPYPSMYVNENGEVDTNPGWESGWDSRGKYKYRHGILTISLEDGDLMELYYRKGVLVGKKYGAEMVFEKTGKTPTTN